MPISIIWDSHPKSTSKLWTIILSSITLFKTHGNEKTIISRIDVCFNVLRLFCWFRHYHQFSWWPLDWVIFFSPPTTWVVCDDRNHNADSVGILTRVLPINSWQLTRQFVSYALCVSCSHSCHSNRLLTTVTNCSFPTACRVPIGTCFHYPFHGHCSSLHRKVIHHCWKRIHIESREVLNFITQFYYFINWLMTKIGIEIGSKVVK